MDKCKTRKVWSHLPESKQHQEYHLLEVSLANKYIPRWEVKDRPPPTKCFLTKEATIKAQVTSTTSSTHLLMVLINAKGMIHVWVKVKERNCLLQLSTTAGSWGSHTLHTTGRQRERACQRGNAFTLKEKTTQAEWIKVLCCCWKGMRPSCGKKYNPHPTM